MVKMMKQETSKGSVTYILSPLCQFWNTDWNEIHFKWESVSVPSSLEDDSFIATTEADFRACIVW